MSYQCEVCGKGFISALARGGHMAVHGGEPRVIIECDNCGGEVKRIKSRINEHNFCSRECCIEWMKKNNIMKERGGRPRTVFISKEELEHLYLGRELSLSKTAEYLGVSPSLILNRLREYGIPTRSLSEAQKGRKHTEEYKKYMSKLHSGENNPMYGKHHTKESRRKMSKSQTGRKHPLEVRTKIGKAHEGMKRSKELRMKLSKIKKKWHQNHENPSTRPEVREKISKALTGRKLSEETKEKLRKKAIERWKDENYRANQIKVIAKATCAKPNKAESELLSIIEGVCPGKYRYNKGSTVIGHKIPDFVNADEGKLIELFGEPWHEPEEEQERIESFAEEGYDCLIIWGNELKYPKRIIKKIDTFIKEMS